MKSPPFYRGKTEAKRVDQELIERESESHSVMSNSLQPHGLYSLPILQAEILKWVAVPFSRGSSQLRNRTQVSCIAGRCFILWATSALFISITLFSVSFDLLQLKLKLQYFGHLMQRADLLENTLMLGKIVVRRRRRWQRMR